MDDLSALIARHGYSLLGMIAFLEAVGFPMPAALALLAAGAACAYGKLNPFVAIGVSVVAILLGDSILFLVGRYTGWGLVGLFFRALGYPERLIFRSGGAFFWRREKNPVAV